MRDKTAYLGSIRCFDQTGRNTEGHLIAVRLRSERVLVLGPSGTKSSYHSNMINFWIS
jgi:hypothetical protein